MTTSIYLVTQPSHDDGDMNDDAESVVAAYTDRQVAIDHASRIWAGHVTGTTLFEALPDWVAGFSRDEQKYFSSRREISHLQILLVGTIFIV